MVESLEDPSEGVDAEIEESASCEVWIHHAVAVGEGVLGRAGHAEVGDGAIYGAYLAGRNDLADVDGKREVSRPDLVPCVSLSYC